MKSRKIQLLCTMVIDYSKWDRMDFDDDDEEEDSDDNVDGRSTPHVTSLDRPGRVTIGPAGSTIELLGDDNDNNLGNKSTNKNNNKYNPVVQSELSTSKKPKVADSDDIGGAIRVGDDVHDNQPQPQLVQLQDEEEDGFGKSKAHSDSSNTTNRELSRITRNGGMHYRTVHVVLSDDHEHHDNVTNSHHGNKNTTGKGREEQITVPIYWSQDRYAVTVRVGINPTIFAPRNIRVECKGALPYMDRHSAVGSGGGVRFGGGDGGENHGSIEIVCIEDGKSGGGGGGENVFVGDRGGEKDERNGKAMTKASTRAVLLSERLYRPIHLNEGEDELDFEIEDCNSDDIDFDNNLQRHDTELDDNDRKEQQQQQQQQQQQHASTTTTSITKFVTIVLPKAVPMIGMTYWWDRLFVGYPTIDMDTIVRSNYGIDSRTKTDRGRGGEGKQKEGEAFRLAWEGAHAAFREKMKTRERQSIDIGE